jgi:hypothetical protein
MAESRTSASAPMPPSGRPATGEGGSRSGGSSMKDVSSQSGSSGESMAELSTQGQEAVSQAQDQAVKLVGMAREQATMQVATQKERAATILGALGTALHDASRQVREQEDAPIADFIDMAADQVEALSHMLNEQDIGQLIDTAQQFARRQPMLFLAAAFAVGFVGTRFLKSASPSAGGQHGSASSWSSGPSNRSGMRSDFENTSSERGASEYGASMSSGGPGAGRH